MDLLQKLIQNLERGKQSAHLIRGLLRDSERSEVSGVHHKGFDDHSMVVLSVFDTSISMLQSSDFLEDITRPRKIARMDNNNSNGSPTHCKLEEESGGEDTPKPIKDRRGCYKRRRNCESEATYVTENLTHDGYAWRKYGQKNILASIHPRNYFRCTHKNDQGCPATKYVQQISENPTKYRVVYNGQHTCKNLLRNNPPILLHSVEEQDSSILLSFETSNPSTAKHALDTFQFTPSPSSSSASASAFTSAVVKQEQGTIKEERQSAPQGHRHHHNHGVHKDQTSSSSDLTITGISTTTSASDQGDAVSSADIYSSTASPHGMEEEDYSNMMADFLDLDEVLQGFMGAQWSSPC